MPAAGTILVAVPIAPPRNVGAVGTLSFAIDKRRKLEGEVLIIKRTDYPGFPGKDYYYAIRQSDKRKWTPGETVMTAEMIADAWYAAGCPEVM